MNYVPIKQRIAEEVSKRPIIFDKTLYRDNSWIEERENAFHQISLILNKERNMNIDAAYVEKEWGKENNTLKRSLQNSKSAKKVAPYMEFFIPYVTYEADSLSAPVTNGYSAKQTKGATQSRPSAITMPAVDAFARTKQMEKDFLIKSLADMKKSYEEAKDALFTERPTHVNQDYFTLVYSYLKSVPSHLTDNYFTESLRIISGQAQEDLREAREDF